jgi:hypothetical protein
MQASEMTMDLEQSGDVASTVRAFVKGCAKESTLTLKRAVCACQTLLLSDSFKSS